MKDNLNKNHVIGFYFDKITSNLHSSSFHISVILIKSINIKNSPINNLNNICAIILARHILNCQDTTHHLYNTTSKREENWDEKLETDKHRKAPGRMEDLQKNHNK